MITIIGDVHGRYDKYLDIISKHDHTIQLGDFGFDYKTLLNVDADNHIIIPGNHDNYDTMCQYPHFMGDYGFTSSFHGLEFFFYRGAYSVDWQHRLIGISWWEDEEVKIEEFMRARTLYRQIKPDLVITHDCPDFLVPQYIGNARVYQNITNWALGELYNIHQPKLWIHGHYHQSKTIMYGKTKFVCLNELETFYI
jgi:calcineurin-like phosphoesterase family protein